MILIMNIFVLLNWHSGMHICEQARFALMMRMFLLLLYVVVMVYGVLMMCRNDWLLKDVEPDLLAAIYYIHTYNL